MTEATHTAGVDFHCHLDLYPDFEAAIAKAEAARIYTLTVTTTPKAWPRNYELTRHTRFVRAALGLHPQLIAERADELPSPLSPPLSRLRERGQRSRLNMNSERYQAVVVGAGLVGAATALALARRGLRVALIERAAHAAPAQIGRANV